MTNLKVFNNSLKISWIKRLKNPTDGWEQFPRFFDIHKIIQFGDRFPLQIIGKINNKFWEDVAQACATFQTKIMTENNKVYNIPLWFNSEINIRFNKVWFQKGYTKLGDILDNEGKLFTNKEMTEKGLQLNFLDYEELRFDISNINIHDRENKMYGPYLPHILYKIGYNEKGCAMTYNSLMNYNNNVITDIKYKWEEILEEDIAHQVLEKSFKNIQKMKEGSFTKYLQFKILHRRIVTNK